MFMLAVAFFSWWYGAGLEQVAASFRTRLRAVAVSFSVSLLLPTLFAPWRRIISYPGRSLEDRVRAAIDNAFSRVIGFIVRLSVLIVASLVMLIVGLLTILELVIWPVLPLAVVAGIIAGLVQ